jgi:telomere length regulation protein
LPSQPSYFGTNLDAIRTRSAEYAVFWAELLISLGSTMMIQSIIKSLLAHLPLPSSPLDTSPHTRSFIRREAQILRRLSGGHDIDNLELLDSLLAVALAKEWNEAHARLIVCRLAGDVPNDGNGSGAFWACTVVSWLTSCPSGLDMLLSQTVELWSSPTHVKHSLLARHRCKRVSSIANPILIRIA